MNNEQIIPKGLPTLYSRTSTGAIQTWTIEYIDGAYRTIHGQLDGKLQTTEWTYCKGKNEGKANATTDSTQTLKEVAATWKKKKESGYFENADDVDTVLFTEPMLAKKYEDYQDDLTFPVYSQPKLDGVRCIARKDGLWSRNGKPIVSVPHIVEALKPVFEKNPDLILDGELYCDKFNNDFNAICSLVKKTKPTEQDHIDSANSIEYWIYDAIDTAKNFRQRFYNVVGEVVDSANSKYIREVATEYVNNVSYLDELYEKHINDGYEGQMVRTNDIYQNKRSKFLLKRKEFQDAEYKILDIIEGEGNRAGGAGAMVFENHKGSRFNSNIKGTREYMISLLQQKDEFIGQLATIKFFNLTPDEIPRFPFVVAIRTYE